MRLIDQLKEHMDDMEESDNWAFNFVTRIAIQKEEQPDKQLTGPQFTKLCEIHSKYCNRR
jgi:hypothetical protein